MPKSKRNKQVELAKTKKRGLEWKKHLFEEVRSCVDSYSNIFVFSVNDMRNSKMKTVREQWKHSRFFIGKNKIMAMALGRFAEEEYKPNLHKIGRQIKGQRGLLFSNKSTEEVLGWFRSYSEGDFARSGNSATDDVKLVAGPLPQFPHNLEPYLRQLGLPTSLVKGVIHLVQDHEVCKAGDILTPETAKIIKLLGYEMAEFHFTIDCVWSQDGSFMQFTEDVDKDDAKENMKNKKRKSSQIAPVVETVSPPDMEEMEVDDSESKTVEVSPNTSEAKLKIESNKSPAKILTSMNKSTPEGKSIDENSETPQECPILIVEKEEAKTPKECPILVVEKEEAKTPKECPILVVEKEETEYFESTPKFGKKKELKKVSRKSSLNGEDDVNNRPSRSRKRKMNVNKVVSKQDSLLLTPDVVKSPEDSPIFRELRNRSVKVSRKKK